MSSIKKTDHFYLIDGSGYIFRAYYALPPLSRKSDGLPTGAVIESSLVVTSTTDGTIGINTGKQIEAEVRNATFDNIDPYGIHFGGNDQGVDVRGLYTSFIFETVDDHMAGWAPHIYVNSADTALIGKITTALA